MAKTPVQINPDTSGGQAEPRRGVFAVKDCALIAIAMGRRVTTHREFRNVLLGVDPESIYHHFWGGLLQARFEEREYNNDFAAWMHESLHDDVLAERMALLDPTDHPDMDTLRQELVDLVDERLEEAEHLNWLRATEPFEFMRAKIVVFDTRRRFVDPRHLATEIETLTPGSIFYHFIDARRRLENSVDDFREWLHGLDGDHETLEASLAAVDPYFVSLGELRAQLAQVFCRHFESRP